MKCAPLETHLEVYGGPYVMHHGFRGSCLVVCYRCSGSGEASSAYANEPYCGPCGGSGQLEASEAFDTYHDEFDICRPDATTVAASLAD